MSEPLIESQKSPRALEEERILAFWKENGIFDKSLSKAAPRGDFIFFEGPPTANGKPAIHHLEARAFKDVIPRYKTMQGFHVGRKGGWDTHGLPVELQVEKELGLKSKKEIETFGVAEFNLRCKQSVFTYLEDWGRFTDRMGYWVDQKNAYYTFHNSYIEKLWGIVGKVESDGLLYKDYKVVPWCARCGTGLSSHELAQGYEDVKDLSVFVRFKIQDSRFKNTDILAWTTTPWTLPGNVALAVGKDFDYVKIRFKIQDSRLENEVILAKERLAIITEEYEIIEEFKGSELVGIKYEPLYNFLTDKFKEKDPQAFERAYQVYEADFVTTMDGTGVVHTAVMYGQDDFVLGNKIGLPKFHLVKEDGHFLEEMDFLSNRFVKEKDENGKPTLTVDIIDDLKKRDLFFKQENIKHSYPHCWRCKTPLIYYARNSWYIKMSALRDTLVAENQKINWEPDYIKGGRFGEWLREVKDWAISRERYWGTPLPVWETEDKSKRVVIDSLETLKNHSRKSNRYILMRHGEADHNIKGVMSCDVEGPNHLTEKGKANARATAEKLKNEKINLIFYSPLARTKETMEEVVSVLGKVRAIEDKRLREEDFGCLSGKSWTELERAYPTFKDRMHKKFEDAETLCETRKRIGEFIYEINESFSGQNILIITHDGPASLFEVVAEGASSDEEFETIYKPGEDFIKVGDYREIAFAPLPHDEEFRLDLHKPYIDEIKLSLPDGRALKRVKEVMDVWFDSGSMPFAQNADGLGLNTKLFPADFISEAIDQTRGWFYTLHAVACLMGRGMAYKNVICLGHLLDKDGKKMSKSLGNVLDPFQMIDKYGVDTLRLWMYSVNQPGESKNFDERTVDEIQKKVFNLLSNVLSFYELYRDKSLEEEAAFDSTHILDRWIVSRLSTLVSTSTNYLDNYKLLEPVRGLRDFIDDLSTWYLRRSRDRLREGDESAKKTLYLVLKTISKFLAPFGPFYAESLYQNLKTTKDKESVHLESWPQLLPASDSIESEMKEARAAVTLALEARSKENIKVRQPLRSLVIKRHIPEEYRAIIADEVNVKEVLIDPNLEGEIKLDLLVTEDLREEGTLRELMRAIQDKRKFWNCLPTQMIKVVLGVEEPLKAILQKQGYKELLQSSVSARELIITDTTIAFQPFEGHRISIEIIQ